MPFQVPDLAEVNKGNIYLSSTSPPSVINAYFKQFQRDFSTFLQCRAEELVPGGAMVLTILGRKSDDHSGKESGYVWELLARALNQLVSEVSHHNKKTHNFIAPYFFFNKNHLQWRIVIFLQVEESIEEWIKKWHILIFINWGYFFFLTWYIDICMEILVYKVEKNILIEVICEPHNLTYVMHIL